MTLLGKSKPPFDENANYRAWTSFAADPNGELIVVNPGMTFPGTHEIVRGWPHLFVAADTLDSLMPHPLSDAGPSGYIRQIAVAPEAA